MLHFNDRVSFAPKSVVIEIGLLDTAFLERDLAVECRLDPKMMALLTCAWMYRVDDGAAIDATYDAPDTQPLVQSTLDFRNLAI